jgi:predicted metalloprotease with PDZ domain
LHFSCQPESGLTGRFRPLDAIKMSTNLTLKARFSVVILACLGTLPAAGAAATKPAAPKPAAPLAGVHYRVSFPAPQTHYVEVEATLPTDRKPQIDVTMPVWTPGSYLVREYSRNIENVAARGPGGQTLAIDKTRKNHWTISTGGAPNVILSYRVYSREMSVRNNWVDDKFALLNGAQTFITLLEPHATRPHEVQIVLPAPWKISISGLPAATDGTANHFVAPDYDTLVDSPIVAGNPAVYEFEVGGKKHYLVNQGEGGIWDGPRSAKDVEKIVREAERFWGALPYEKYVFFNLLVDSGGGLEHKSSCTLMSSRWATTTRDRYVNWLDLVGHEYFHAWNVKRLRPVELGPFDYENEVYTTGLFIAEGFTDYFGPLLVRRAGLVTDAEYLREISNNIRELQTTPGRLAQPVDAASYDAWIKYYRPDENSANVSVSYYTKGAIIAFLLDAKIRHATNGAKSLDDVMRLAFQRFGGPKGYTVDEFRKTAEEATGVDLREWWHKAVDTTEELDYTEALDLYGFRFATFGPGDRRGRGGSGSPVATNSESAATGAGTGGRAWLGLTYRNDNGRLLVSQVRRGTPGFDAGFSVDDEILAIGDFRVRPDQFATRLESYRPGQTVTFLVARRDELTRLTVTFGSEPEERWRIEPRPDATADQQHARQIWVTGTH